MTALKFYSKRLGPKLKALIEEQCENGNDTEQLQLLDEVILTREVAGLAVQCYSVAHEKGDVNAVLLAASLMKDALRDVAEMASKASRIRAECKDTITPNQLQDVVSQICRFVYECFGDHEGVARFDQLISEQLRLPGIGKHGTMLRPDSDMTQINSLVPYVPEDNPETSDPG